MKPVIVYDVNRVKREDVEAARFGGIIPADGPVPGAVQFLFSPPTQTIPARRSDLGAVLVCAIMFSLALGIGFVLGAVAVAQGLLG